MRSANTSNEFLPVPTHLHPLVDDIEAATIPVDLKHLEADIYNPSPTTRAGVVHRRARHLLADRVEETGGVFQSADLAVSSRSHALVERSGLRFSFDAISPYLRVPEGHEIRFVDVDVTPFAAVAHLAGDAVLASTTGTGTVAYVAATLNVPAFAAKKALYALLTGTDRDQLARRVGAGGGDLDALMPRLDRLAELFPEAATYARHLAAYGGAAGPAQALTNRVAHLAHANVHTALREAGIPAAPFALATPGAVAYQVPKVAVVAFDDVVLTTRGRAEGVTLSTTARTALVAGPPEPGTQS